MFPNFDLDTTVYAQLTPRYSYLQNEPFRVEEENGNTFRPCYLGDKASRVQ